MTKFSKAYRDAPLWQSMGPEMKRSTKLPENYRRGNNEYPNGEWEWWSYDYNNDRNIKHRLTSWWWELDVSVLLNSMTDENWKQSKYKPIINIASSKCRYILSQRRVLTRNSDRDGGRSSVRCVVANSNRYSSCQKEMSLGKYK